MRSCLLEGSGAATVFSLLKTAKANELDPFKYLVYIFGKLL